MMDDDHFNAAFLSLASALNPSIVPEADADDMMSGAKSIPGWVTDARRQGKRVDYDPVRGRWTSDEADPNEE